MEYQNMKHYYILNCAHFFVSDATQFLYNRKHANASCTSSRTNTHILTSDFFNTFAARKCGYLKDPTVLKKIPHCFNF